MAYIRIMRPRKGQEKHATRRVGLRLPADLRGALEHLAKVDAVTITDIMIAAMRFYVKARMSREGWDKP